MVYCGLFNELFIVNRLFYYGYLLVIKLVFVKLILIIFKICKFFLYENGFFI